MNLVTGTLILLIFMRLSITVIIGAFKNEDDRLIIDVDDGDFIYIPLSLIFNTEKRK